MKIIKRCETCGKVMKLENYSYVIIDTDSNILTCGVKGIIEGSNIRIVNNKILCGKCGLPIYEEEK